MSIKPQRKRQTEPPKASETSAVPQTMQENKRVAQSGGKAAKAARDEVEKQIGHSVISRERASNYLIPTEDAEVREIENNKEI